MTRTHSWPEGHWDWPFHTSHKHGLRDGDMMYVGGQVDLDSSGQVLHRNDLKSQTAEAMAHIGKVLAGLDADLGDVVKLQAFYQNDGSRDEAAFLADIARHLPATGPGPVIHAVPVPALAYDGMIVEIEAIAMRGAKGKRLERQAASIPSLWAPPKPFSQALRVGEMIFVGGTSAIGADGKVGSPGEIVPQSAIVMDAIGALLNKLGATLDDAVKINTFYAGAGTVEDWSGAARTRARYFVEPGPAATGIPLPRHALPGVMTRTDIIAMRGTDGSRLPREHVWPVGHWDWPFHLPYKHGIKCGRMLFVGGQVSMTSGAVIVEPNDLVKQTRISMDNIAKVLAGFGLGFDNTVKVNAFYRGGASYEQLQDNLSIRSSCFTEPGPATTGVPLPALAYPGMMIEIEIIAMTD